MTTLRFAIPKASPLAPEKTVPDREYHVPDQEERDAKRRCQEGVVRDRVGQRQDKFAECIVIEIDLNNSDHMTAAEKSRLCRVGGRWYLLGKVGGGTIFKQDRTHRHLSWKHYIRTKMNAGH